MPPAATQDRPFGDNRFRVTVKGNELGVFSEVSGLSVEWETVTRYEGGRHRPTTLLGNLKVSNLVLKRGVITQPELLRFFHKAEGTSVDVIVDLIGADGKSKASWTLTDCRPVKWQGPQLNGATNGVATETLELSVSSLVATDDPPVA